MRATLPLLLLAAATFACNGRKASEAAPAGPVPAVAPAAPALSGKVLERIDAAPYSYLHVQSATGEFWAAVPQNKLDKGADITLVSPLPMNNFESKILKRKFDLIFFGTLGSPSGSAGAPAPAPAPAPMAPQAATPMLGEKVAKATGADAKTIAEAYAQKAHLKGKTVTIKGTVVKFNASILGKNWIHLQDGSGDAKSSNFDIAVTSQDQATKGQVITIQGVLNTDQDFGSGYTYSVIVENAKVLK